MTVPRPPRAALRAARWFVGAALVVAGAVPTTDSVAADTNTEAARTAARLATSAMELGQWRLAVGYLRDAQRTLPRAAPILRLLGVSTSRAGGADPLAIAWRRAYLAANPATVDADLVRAEIDELEDRVSATIRAVLDEASRIANAHRGDPSTERRDRAFVHIARAQAALGDVAAAERAVSEITSGFERSQARGAIALAIVRAGDVSRASQMALLIEAHGVRDETYAAMAKLRAAAGDGAGARALVAQIARDRSREHTYADLIEAHVTAGNPTAAVDTIAAAGSAEHRRALGVRLAAAHAQAGDLAAARHTLRTLGSPETDIALSLAVGHARQGTVAEALRLAEQVNEGLRDALYLELTEVLADLDKRDAATRLAARIRDARWKSVALRIVAEARAERGDIAGARQTAATVRDAAERAATYTALGAPRAHVPRTAAGRPDGELGSWIDLINRALLGRRWAEDSTAHLATIERMPPIERMAALSETAASAGETLAELRAHDTAWRARRPATAGLGRDAERWTRALADDAGRTLAVKLAVMGRRRGLDERTLTALRDAVARGGRRIGTLPATAQLTLLQDVPIPSDSGARVVTKWIPVEPTETLGPAFDRMVRALLDDPAVVGAFTPARGSWRSAD